MNCGIESNLPYQGFRPRLIEFHGFEGEDFRHFKHTLETFFSIMGINSSSRKLTIMVSQLRRAASTFYSRFLKTQKANDPNFTPSYEEVMDILQDKYITPALVQRFELAFNDLVQGQDESPQLFLARLYEAAELAEIDDENMIHSRFRAGLLRPIRVFCIQSSSKTFEDWLTHADGWWNAHKPINVNLVDNPFVASGNVKEQVEYRYPAGISHGHSFANLKTSGIAHVTSSRKKAPSSQGPSTNLTNVATIDSEVEQLSARLRSLELHQLDKLQNPNEEKPHYVSEPTYQARNEMSEMDIVSLIRKTIKEELHQSSSQFTHGNYSRDRGTRSRPNPDHYPQRDYGNRRRYNSHFRAKDMNNDSFNQPHRSQFFDNDYMYPSEGYYRSRPPMDPNPNYSRRQEHHDDRTIANKDYGQLSKTPNTKSINQINYINNDDYTDLYAARLVKPPAVTEVSKTMKDTKIKRVTKKDKDSTEAIKRSVKNQANQIQSRSTVEPSQDALEPMMDVTPTTIYESPSIVSSQSKPIVTRRKMIKPNIQYDIADDVLSTKANINLGDLLTASPQLKRDLIKAWDMKKTIASKPDIDSATDSDDSDYSTEEEEFIENDEIVQDSDEDSDLNCLDLSLTKHTLASQPVIASKFEPGDTEFLLRTTEEILIPPKSVYSIRLDKIPLLKDFIKHDNKYHFAAFLSEEFLDKYSGVGYDITQTDESTLFYIVNYTCKDFPG
ncbi:hypothetical protein EDC96DRAFT_550158 [Choanephora cucurbitarum]|nr:hypothetical protein EDC96DRAFT_550158 [Choanephora cucurbitarum]